jgi:uncharacterized protein YcbK (DUF882 family)
VRAARATTAATLLAAALAMPLACAAREEGRPAIHRAAVSSSPVGATAGAGEMDDRGGAAGSRSTALAAAPGSEPTPEAAAASPAPSAARPAGNPKSRFFLSGDGTIALQNEHTGERLRVQFRDARGAYSQAAMTRIDRLFRSRGDDEETRVSLRLIELIDFIEDRWHPQSIQLLSGYRSGEYNAALIARGGKQARTSMHTEGLAADLHFAGLDQRELWLALRELECCGAGYYKTNGFLHLDVGKPRFWEETTSRVGENLSRGNARVIARTDFDRYDALDGAEIRLHAVTLWPLRVARGADLAREGDAGAASDVVRPVRLAAMGHGALASDDCIEFPPSETPPPIALRVEDRGVSAAAPGAARGRARIVLHTCEPRLEATPERIETNPIELPLPPG